AGQVLRGDGALGDEGVARFGSGPLGELDLLLEGGDGCVVRLDGELLLRRGRQRLFGPARHVLVDDAPGALEDTGEGVVILVRDRVELVIVTAGTADGHAEEGLAEGVELLVD